MRRMILFSGKAEHGKTTASEILKKRLEEMGYKVVITRYAYYLKDLATRYCGWNGQKDSGGRELLQQLGTDIIRQKLNKPNFHVGRICEDIEICQDYVDFVIIDDARFPNEIYYPKAIFGNKVMAIRVNRLNADWSQYSSSLTEEQKQHLSEVALDDFNFDYTITAANVGSLRHQIEEVLLLITV